MKSLLAFTVVCGSLFAYSQTKRPSGEIKGTVVDQAGSPISFATVYVVPQGLTLDEVPPRSVKTDRNGAFDFHGGLALGIYKLYPRKDADGYLDPFDSFYADTDAIPAQAVLTRQHPSSNVTVKLGKPAAVISGRIYDANSGAPLEASLGYVDREGHGHQVRVTGDYRVMVPSGKQVTLWVHLPGTGRALPPGAPLRLEPGQRVYLDFPIPATEN